MKTADQILRALAGYCKRIDHSRHYGRPSANQSITTTTAEVFMSNSNDSENRDDWDESEVITPPAEAPKGPEGELSTDEVKRVKAKLSAKASQRDVPPSGDDEARHLWWHYTTMEGLVGILGSFDPHARGCRGSLTLRASNARYLNDARELTFGIRALSSALAVMADELGGANGGGLEYSRLSEELKGNLPSTVLDDLEAYVCCFCAEGDLVSQWYGYAGGLGISLGFDSRLFAELKTARGDPVDKGDVAYGDEALWRMFRQVWRAARRGLDIDEQVSERILNFAARCKHDSFRGERERRLYTINPRAGVHLRSNSSRLIPYVEIEVPAESLREVMVGPHIDQFGQVKAIRSQLEHIEKRTAGQIRTTCSRSPFRA